MTSFETIASIATPPGRGGIGVIRVSGPQAIEIGKIILGKTIPSRTAMYLPFYGEEAVLDEGIALFFPGPHSFTGEDVLELQSHGSPVVMDLLMQRLVSLGARLARPGEFSERAFLNGKIDLTQAEAVADLIEAASDQAARLALRALQGEFSRAILAVNEKVIYLRTYLEAAIDFSDEDIAFLSQENIKTQFTDLLHDLQSIQSRAQEGSVLREGMSAVIVGAPNAGKSSLLNCLSGTEAAIVTDLAGTTRDVLRQTILIDGLPLHIIDTAGLRQSQDVIEREGMRRAYQEIEKADLILHIQDATATKQYDLHELMAFIDVSAEPIIAGAASRAEEGGSVLPYRVSERGISSSWKEKKIVIRNKIDLLQEEPSCCKQDNQMMLSVSIKKNQGVDLLKQAIKQLAGLRTTNESLFFARRRHLDALAQASLSVATALEQWEVFQSLECAAYDLSQAHRALGEIIGQYTTDDLLGRIFSSFCIGK